MSQTTDNHPAPQQALDGMVLIECVQHAYTIAPRIFLSALSLAVLLVAGLWLAVPHLWLSIWFIALTVCYAARVVLWKRYRATPESNRDTPLWSRWFVWGAGITGLTWGISGVLPAQSDHGTQFYIGFVLTGVCAGAVPGLSYIPYAARVFVLGAILPFTAHAIVNGPHDGILMGTMSLLFTAVMMVTIKNTFTAIDLGIRQQLQLQQRDAALVANEKLQRETRETLRRAQTQLQNFIDYAPAAVAMFNRKLRYLAYSKRWVVDFGLNLAPEEVLHGRSYFEVLPDLAGMMREAFDHALRGEVQTNDQYPYIRNDGLVQWFHWEMRPWYEDSGEMGGIVMFSEDITETRRTKVALQMRDRLLEQLGQQVPGVMFQGRWRPGSEFRFTFVSANASLVCGYSAEQLLQQKQLFEKLFAPSELNQLREAAQRAASRAGTIEMQLRMNVPDKGTRWMQVNVVAERLADASVVWHGYIEDVTLRHQMAIELAKMNIEIENGIIHSSAA